MEVSGGLRGFRSPQRVVGDGWNHGDTTGGQSIRLEDEKTGALRDAGDTQSNAVRSKPPKPALFLWSSHISMRFLLNYFHLFKLQDVWYICAGMQNVL